MTRKEIEANLHTTHIRAMNAVNNYLRFGMNERLLHYYFRRMEYWKEQLFSRTRLVKRHHEPKH